MTTILLTGAPGCGKTTLIRGVLARLNRPAGGFYTQEVRQNGVRQNGVRQGGERIGFEIVMLDGALGRLAQASLASKYRVGKYGVDLAFLERVAIPGLYATARDGQLVVVDEIGPMECFSAPFRQAVLDILAERNDLLGTIVRRSYPFADQIKRHPFVEIIEVRPDNREALAGQIYQRFYQSS
jgi:nucleoside-triphosphatase